MPASLQWCEEAASHVQDLVNEGNSNVDYVLFQLDNPKKAPKMELFSIGKGGRSQVETLLLPETDKVITGAFLTSAIDERGSIVSVRRKYVHVIWVGTSVGIMVKGKVNTSMTQPFKDMFPGCAMYMQLSDGDVDDMQADVLEKALLAAGGAQNATRYSFTNRTLIGSLQLDDTDEQRRQEEEEQRQAELAAARKRAAEKEAKRKADAEAKSIAEDEAKRKADAERRQAEQVRMAKLQEEEAARKAKEKEQDEALKAEEVKRKAQEAEEEEARRRKAQEEEAQKELPAEEEEAWTPKEALSEQSLILIMLISSMSGNMATSNYQALAKSLLESYEVTPEVIDGADPQNKEMRNELFSISGLRGKYPQFFLRRKDRTTIKFFGDYETLAQYHDNGTLGEQLGSSAAPKNISAMTNDSTAPAIVSTLNGNKLLLLISSMSGSMEVAANQQRIEGILKGLQLPKEEVEMMDGCLPEVKERRNELFGISGIRAKYPQLFLVNITSGETAFVGNSEDIFYLHDTNTLAKAVGLVTTTVRTVPKMVSSLNGNKLLLLISSMPGNLEVISNQTRVESILKGLCLSKEEVELIDGCDPAIKERRNELFGISGIRAKYPQLFLENIASGETAFVGNYDDFSYLIDTNTFAQAVGLVTKTVDGPSTADVGGAQKTQDNQVSTADTSTKQESRETREVAPVPISSQPPAVEEVSQTESKPDPPAAAPKPVVAVEPQESPPVIESTPTETEPQEVASPTATAESVGQEEETNEAIPKAVKSQEMSPKARAAEAEPPEVVSSEAVETEIPAKTPSPEPNQESPAPTPSASEEPKEAAPAAAKSAEQVEVEQKQQDASTPPEPMDTEKPTDTQATNQEPVARVKSKEVASTATTAPESSFPEQEGEASLETATAAQEQEEVASETPPAEETAQGETSAPMEQPQEIQSETAAGQVPEEPSTSEIATGQVSEETKKATSQVSEEASPDLELNEQTGETAKTSEVEAPTEEVDTNTAQAQSLESNTAKEEENETKTLPSGDEPQETRKAPEQEAQQSETKELQGDSTPEDSCNETEQPPPAPEEIEETAGSLLKSEPTQPVEEVERQSPGNPAETKELLPGEASAAVPEESSSERQEMASTTETTSEAANEETAATGETANSPTEESKAEEPVAEEAKCDAETADAQEQGDAVEAESGDIMLLPSPRLEVLSFAVSVPGSTTMETLAFDDDYYEEEEVAATDAKDPLAAAPKRKPPPAPSNTSVMDGIGMVGTITVLKTSYVIWFGWGQTQEVPMEERVGVNYSHIVGSTKGTSVAMGQFLIAMPPRKFGGSKESSTSKLIGGEFDDDMIARPMACRLSQKCGCPVLISCSLDPAHIQSMGLDPDLLHGRAAALAEKRIWDLLKPYHSAKEVAGEPENDEEVEPELLTIETVGSEVTAADLPPLVASPFAASESEAATDATQ